MFNAKHSVRVALLAVTAGTALTASLAGAGAAQAQVFPRGFSSVESCTGLSGSISWHPGLHKTSVTRGSAVLTGTLTGCSGANGAQAGTGTVTAVLHGSSSLASVTEAGAITGNWPASSGLNPSNGTVTVRRAAADQPYTVSGSVTSGAFTGAQLSTSLSATTQKGTGSKRHPVVSQQFVNTLPLAARVNLG